MRIHIRVKPNSKMNKIENFGSGRYLVYLKEPLEGGKADAELVHILSKYFGTPPSKILIRTGINNENKVLEFL